MKLRVCFVAFLASLSTVSIVPAAVAGGDIVYCARYYASPTSKETSHFHLYSIDPSGRGRKQLTAGAYDDGLLGWSPDGKSILYTSDNRRLCVMEASTGKARVILSSAKGVDLDVWNAFWWPDSKAVIILGSGTDPARVISVSTGKALSTVKDVQWLSISSDGDRAYVNNGAGGEVVSLDQGYKVSVIRPLPVAVNAATWATDEAIVGVAEGEGDASDSLVGFNENGTKLWVRGVAPKHSSNVDLGTPFRNVTAIPGDRRNVVLGEDISDSTIRPNYNFWHANVDTGNATVWLSEKRYVVFKPNASDYVTSPAQVLVNFGKPNGGHQHQVYVCGLQVGKGVDDAKPRTIVDGMVFVEGADWR